jgi:predicted nucleic acid-binding protein
MRTDGEEIVVYWDTSAVLSTLFSDNHSDEALNWANRGGFHFLSSLGYAETCAVIGRMRRERKVAELLAEAAMEAFNGGPWRRVNAQPAWNQMAMLSKKWDLRSADLWHLALAKSLRDQIPELIFLTFDRKLRASAQGEGFVMETEDLS